MQMQVIWQVQIQVQIQVQVQVCSCTGADLSSQMTNLITPLVGADVTVRPVHQEGAR